MILLLSKLAYCSKVRHVNLFEIVSSSGQGLSSVGTMKTVAPVAGCVPMITTNSSSKIKIEVVESFFSMIFFLRLAGLWLATYSKLAASVNVI